MVGHRQIIYSLCSKRERIISRNELQHQISAIVADTEQGKLLAEFETISPPDDYQPDGMLARQIKLVGGTQSDHSKAIREEWKAREQRAKWLNSNPAMAALKQSSQSKSEKADDLALAEFAPVFHDRESATFSWPVTKPLNHF